MCIAEATLTDTNEITALVNSAYRGETSKQGWTSEAHLLDGQRIDNLMVLSYLQSQSITILKHLDAGNRINGCVYLEKKGDKLYLGMLTVSPPEQGVGIGKKLLAAAEQHAENLGCNAITITVITTRAELIAWYERHGYIQTGELRQLPNDERFGIQKKPVVLLVMDKPLLQPIR